MAKTIIDIDVNDDAFKAFAEKFERYKADLKSLPGEWGKTEKTVDSVAEGFQAMTAAILAQTLMLHEQVQELEKLEKEEAKAAKGKTDAQKAEAKAMADRKRDTAKLVQHTKNIAGNIAKTTFDLLKWVGIGTAFTGLLGIGGFFGLGALADQVGDSRRISQGLGVSIGDRQAFNIDFARYGMGDDTLEKVANAKTDVTKWGALAAMGVNAAGKDPVELTLELQRRAKSIYGSSGKTQQEMDARGVTQFFSMDQLRQLDRTSNKELNESAASMRAHQKQLAVLDGAAKQWQDFSVQLKLAGASIQTTFVTLLTPLIPKLTELSKFIVTQIAAFLRGMDLQKWITNLATEIQHFTSYLTSPKFHDDMVQLGHDVHLVVEGMVKALRFFHLIPDAVSDDPYAGPEAQAAQAGAVARTSAGRAKADNALVDYYVGQGWKTHQAAAIVAGFEAESGLNPFAAGDRDKVTGKYMAYGIGQWHPDRQAEYAKLFGHTMQSVHDETTARSEQMQFAQYELTKGKEMEAGRLLRNSPTAAIAGFNESKYYERPKDPDDQKAYARGRAAQVIVTVHQKVHVQNATGGSAAVSTNAAAQ
jgi:hypothetical protein